MNILNSTLSSESTRTPCYFRNAAHICEVLGDDVLLLPWPRGSKGTRKKWGHLTIADMTPDYIAKLDRGNIGVVLGAKSGHLVAIDVDEDSLVERYLALNPWMRKTLQTHGKRGRVIWLRMQGEHPETTVKLKTPAGADVGEWRAGTNTQSIIHGTHPETQKPYQVVNMARPLAVSFASIVWPGEVINAPCLEKALTLTATEEPEDPEETEEPDEVGAWLLTVSSVEDVLRASTPTSIHQNYRQALVLARGVKALEQQSGNKFTPEQHRDLHAQWLTRAAKFLRPGQSGEDYFLEYLSAYRLAKYPLGSAVLVRAIEAAKKNPIPPAALAWITNPDVRQLATICRELQTIAGSEPFYLASRVVQRIFKHDTHATGAKWMRALCAMDVLHEVKKGMGKMASRYRFNFSRICG